MKNNPLPDIEIRSEEVQEIVSQLPGWLNRWGITFIFCFFAVLLILGWFIKYPDIVDAKVVLTTSPPPLMLVTRTAGNISVLKEENARVSKGEVIGFIQTNCIFTDVLTAERLIAHDDSIHITKVGRQLILGDLQPHYTSFVNAVNELENFKALDLPRKQTAQLRLQEMSYLKLSRALTAQLALSKEEHSLAHGRFRRDSLLFAQKVLSPQDYNTAQALFLQQKRNLKNAESAIVNNEIQIQLTRKQISDIECQKIDRLSTLLLNVENARKELASAISKWKETYLLVSPSEGTLAYLSFIETNIFIEQGTNLFSVIPDTKQVYAQAEIPIQGSGKVKVNQQVNIRLDNYPHVQFGILRGTITEISELPSDNNYLARITLTNNLTTTYNKTLPFKQKLQGNTEIITEDLRILERVFYQLRLLIRNSPN